MATSALTRWQRLVAFLLAQANETSTARGLIQGAVVVFGLSGDEAHMLKWTAIAVAVSSILKMILPDKWTKG